MGMYVICKHFEDSCIWLAHMLERKLIEFELWLIYFLFIICSLMIKSIINEGNIVPSEVTIKLLQQAMEESGNDKFLIDGFPRNEENRAAFEAVVSLLSHLFPLFSFEHVLL